MCDVCLCVGGMVTIAFVVTRCHGIACACRVCERNGELFIVVIKVVIALRFLIVVFIQKHHRNCGAAITRNSSRPKSGRPTEVEKKEKNDCIRNKNR